MHFVLYLLLMGLSIYVGKLDKRINILGVSLAPPLVVLTFLGIILITYAFLKIALLLGVILLFISKKLKFIIGMKIAALIVTSIASFFGLFVIGPGWLMSLIGLFIIIGIISSMIDLFKDTYRGILRTMAALLLGIRKYADSARNSLPTILKFLVLFIEIPLVCGLAVKGLWEVMDFFDENYYESDISYAMRFATVILYSAILYKGYIKATTPPKDGEDGIDTPLLYETQTVVVATLDH